MTIKCVALDKHVATLSLKKLKFGDLFLIKIVVFGHKVRLMFPLGDLLPQKK
jgi:hypothetical protein